MSTNKIEFKVVTDENNEPVSFGEITPKAALAFTKLVECITKIVNEVNSELKIEIFPGSMGVRSNGPETVIKTISETIEALVDRNYSDSYSLEPYNELRELIHANGLSYETSITLDDVKIDYTSKIKASNKRFFRKHGPKATYSYSLKFLTGKLIEVGGKRPNIHLEIANRVKPLTIECTEANAKKAMPFLYNIISISAWERKKNGYVDEYEFCDVYGTFELYDTYKNFMARYYDLNELDKFSDVYDVCRDLIEENDYGGLRKFLRIFNHPSTDMGVLHTILMITSKFNEVDLALYGVDMDDVELKELHIKQISLLKNMWSDLKEVFDRKIK